MPSSKEYLKQYYLNNKDKFQSRSAVRVQTKYDCECGGKYSLSYKATHLKTKKHVKFMQSKGSVSVFPSTSSSVSPPS